MPSCCQEVLFIFLYRLKVSCDLTILRPTALLPVFLCQYSEAKYRSSAAADDVAIVHVIRNHQPT
ncbi:hypothetical protein V6R21_02255 [Limibacter armeniacum]|uniref:hypothetical protein n=1 Tax=Limibacter armeniacum TaxID=466084 RepID=UPI002FE52E25